jgi:hypothetical protein
VTDFIALMRSKIESYIPHNCVSKAQLKHLTLRREIISFHFIMAENEGIIFIDCSEHNEKYQTGSEDEEIVLETSSPPASQSSHNRIV